MSKERELLERLLSNWEHPCSGRFGDLFDEVRELLSTSEPEIKSDPDSVDLQSRCRGDKL